MDIVFILLSAGFFLMTGILIFAFEKLRGG
jgi:hypothetical protein